MVCGVMTFDVAGRVLIQVLQSVRTGQERSFM